MEAFLFHTIVAGSIGGLRAANRGEYQRPGIGGVKANSDAPAAREAGLNCGRENFLKNFYFSSFLWGDLLTGAIFGHILRVFQP